MSNGPRVNNNEYNRVGNRNNNDGDTIGKTQKGGPDAEAASPFSGGTGPASRTDGRLNLNLEARVNGKDNGLHLGHYKHSRTAEVANKGDQVKNTLFNQTNANSNRVNNNRQTQNTANYTNTYNQPSKVNSTNSTINNQSQTVNPLNQTANNQPLNNQPQTVNQPNSTLSNQPLNNQNQSVNRVAADCGIQNNCSPYQEHGKHARRFDNQPPNLNPFDYSSSTTNRSRTNTPTFNQANNAPSWANINNPNAVTLPRQDHNDAGFRTTPQANLLSSATAYLRGLSDGSNLSPQTRQVLNLVADALGEDFINRLAQNPSQSTVRIFEQTFQRINGCFLNSCGNSGNFKHGNKNENVTIQSAVDDLLSAYQLSGYFDRMERSGGNIVRQAETELSRFLFGLEDGPDGILRNNEAGDLLRGIISDKLLKGFTPEEIIEYLSLSKVFRDIGPAEILRDLRSGSFLSQYETYNPFPLTGRARVVSEMIELMHTLDAVEQFTQALAREKAKLAQLVLPQAEKAIIAEKLLAGMDIPDKMIPFLKAALANEKLFTLEEFLALWQVALPGRAARSLIPEIVLAMNGIFPNVDGRMLAAKDGTPLVLDKLIWFSLAGGIVSNMASTFDNFPTRLSPLLLYGFDAIYSVIGFDGRTLGQKHFAVVQAQINDSNPEWVYGQQTLSLGWMHELIERLKDSCITEHNLLGEQLEEALAQGCFHTILINISVDEGCPATDDVRVKQFAQGSAADFVFAPATVS